MAVKISCGPAVGRLPFTVGHVGIERPSELNPNPIRCREFQGPVTAAASVEGLLIIAWGARLESHKWTGVKLETTAFHEASIMLTSLSTIKRFVTYGDLHKGVTFLQMAENSGTFNSLAKVKGNPKP